jgi:hypothetical protein
VTLCVLSLPPIPHHCLLPSGLNAGSGIPTSPASPDIRAKRTNPLVDLIDTEKLYVDQLTGIIRVRFPSRATLWGPSRAIAHD